MESVKVDRRILKTKRAIRNAFVELLATRNLNDITVTDLAELADINRKTFYHYYNGIYQVMDEIEDEIIHAFEADIEDLNIWEPDQMMSRIFRMVVQNIDFYEKLFCPDTNSQLVIKIISALQEKTYWGFCHKYQADPQLLCMISSYIVAGCVNIFYNWFNSNRSVPIEEVIDIVNSLAANTLRAYLPSP